MTEHATAAGKDCQTPIPFRDAWSAPFRRFSEKALRSMAVAEPMPAYTQRHRSPPFARKSCLLRRFWQSCAPHCRLTSAQWHWTMHRSAFMQGCRPRRKPTPTTSTTAKHPIFSCENIGYRYRRSWILSRCSALRKSSAERMISLPFAPTSTIKNLPFVRSSA